MTATTLPDDFLNRLTPGTLIGVAVSGGGDSMALLHLMLKAGARVSVATVNHNLRDEAADEAQAVGAFCSAHDVPHEILHWHWDGTGNLQDCARRGRYGLLAEWAKRVGAAGVAVGHTADDNIETFLMELSRGAGLDGLSAMSREFKRDGVTFHRPMLHLRRSDLRDVLQEADITWSDDPSNDDPSYHRIRLRQHMAALEAAGLSAQMILTSIGHLHDTRRGLVENLAQELDGHFKLDRGDLCFELSWLEQLSTEPQRRVLNCALRFVSGQDYAPRGAKLMRVLADLRQKAVLHGCVLTSAGDTLRVAREYGAVSELRVPTTECWDGRWRVEGPHTHSTEIAALGETGLAQCGDVWRDAGLPRVSLLASPAVWDGDVLLSAPLAGWDNGWRLMPRQHDQDFREFVLSH
ncbi:tRNA lysidine(34) synthetase TilS [Litoreibacter janthinus]|uniref:tRNA(Ile)-lysidine synthase n=1 Tax=Litoreibacter janthinus TaxID=670154 RepID=A0A1I6HTC8_9RHOB|nr:tRNA lysidine(34) synthetase TilS [Litoreibacter janthinus]SFR57683.1 tRNA(Ile)-lysidine synthase [Litoreibacter janthinus]